MKLNEEAENEFAAVAPDAHDDDEHARFERLASTVVNTPKPLPEDEPAAS